MIRHLPGVPNILSLIANNDPNLHFSIGEGAVGTLQVEDGKSMNVFAIPHLY